MGSPRIKLDLFPAEVIQRIASFSSCESVLALLQVNRILYKTCNDALVFKSIIENGSGHGVLKPWKCDLISQSTSTSTLARLALADSRARTWLAGIELCAGSDELLGSDMLGENQRMPQDEEQKPRDDIVNKSLLKWAPQLVALHHPFIAEGELLGLVAQFQIKWNSRGYLGQYPQSDFAISLCVVSTILHLEEKLRKILSTQTFNPDLGPAGFACALLLKRGAQFRQIQPPAPYKIPFPSLLDIPMPFSSEGFLGTSHLRVMTSVPFLESGEWVGYYSYSLNLTHPDRVQIDPPMTGIHFASNPELGVGGLQASGVDSVGNFALSGNFHANGVVQMRKTYAQGFFWDWSASMTPFGIVGYWGGRGRYQGLFWLWKKEWC
ncbi:hypothetical protein NA56DRAFT_652142 [Hyaloscypha hepaticicola]|uniref:F-box domain-containing protein n=1 Tax=Hyaloscypha hepaticicola TaxID=2082293 RepID=A0A2J6PFR8_9HELO|nr:hypothetical protein NA56DRAFT_652142 [Hyaloscypha hepaticicola]